MPLSSYYFTRQQKYIILNIIIVLYLCIDISFVVCIGYNAVTSSIRIAQVFPELVGKKTRAKWKVNGGMLKNIIN